MISMQEITCGNCAKKFWGNADDAAIGVCVTCLANGRNLSIRPIPAVAPVPMRVQTLRSADVGIKDLSVLLEDAFAPVQTRPQTFGEWFFSVDPVKQQLDAKARHAETAKKLIEGRTEIITAMHKLVLKTRELEDVEVETERRRRQTEIEFLRLEIERLTLADQIRDHIEVAPIKRENLRGQEERRNALAKPNGLTDPGQRERDRLRSESAARQTAIKDFMQEAVKAWLSGGSDMERALRIRSVLDTYQMEARDLPKELSALLNKVERRGRK